MFEREADMADSAARWMKRLGAHVKHEFATPWGICDLVGTVYDDARVAQRLAYGQRRPIASISRAAALLGIPDFDSDEGVTFRQLSSRLADFPTDLLRIELERLIVDGYVIRTSEGKLQKLNGWAPLHTRLIAIELKLKRVDEAMRQAVQHLGFATESYVALPADVADRVVDMQGRWARYIEAGVGVLRLTSRTCRVLIDSHPNTATLDPAIQMQCADRFWSARLH